MIERKEGRGRRLIEFLGSIKNDKSSVEKETVNEILSKPILKVR